VKIEAWEGRDQGEGATAFSKLRFEDASSFRKDACSTA